MTWQSISLSGLGSGARICEEYGVPNLFQMPIVPELSACGDGGRPLVLVGPSNCCQPRHPTPRTLVFLRSDLNGMLQSGGYLGA